MVEADVAVKLNSLGIPVRINTWDITDLLKCICSTNLHLSVLRLGTYMYPWHFTVKLHVVTSTDPVCRIHKVSIHVTHGVSLLGKQKGVFLFKFPG